jgi:mannobiose 2-epimerase
MTMALQESLQRLRHAMEDELLGHILPYWKTNMVDHENGGFFGKIDGKNKVIKNAPKGGILNARILWTFSAAYRQYPDSTTLLAARRAYMYFTHYFLDAANGGVYWMLDASGKPLDDKKHVYAQSFAIYGLSEFYLATQERAALDIAIALFRAIESKAFVAETNGYIEAFDRSWVPLADARLGVSDAPEKRSFNTHLHLLEAYANLYRAWPDPQLKKQLANLISLHIGPMYESHSGRFISFFDEQWNPRSTVHSYGHDIESTWLICDAADAIGDIVLQAKARQVALEVAHTTMREGLDTCHGGLFNTGIGGKPLDTDKHWWAQAEGIVGYLNAWQLSGDEHFVSVAESLWNFIEQNLLDRTHGEWFWRVDKNGKPNDFEDKAGPWKCPYHTARACLEVQKRATVPAFVTA